MANKISRTTEDKDNLLGGLIALASWKQVIGSSAHYIDLGLGLNKPQIGLKVILLTAMKDDQREYFFADEIVCNALDILGRDKRHKDKLLMAKSELEVLKIEIDLPDKLQPPYREMLKHFNEDTLQIGQATDLLLDFLNQLRPFNPWNQQV